MIAATPEVAPPHVIAVSGSTGLIGSALVADLRARGRTVQPLVRGGAGPGEIAWYPESARIDMSRLEEVDAVVHLAGEPVGRRWTGERKRRIRASRVEGTRILSEALSLLERPPRVLVCASAIGYFGDRGNELLEDDSPPGSGFLADVTREWEAATHDARRAEIRVVHLRFGVVLARDGGALAKMRLPFWLGVGGRLGSGRQWMSWVALADVVGIIRLALDLPELRGSINAVAPQPVTNRDFTRALGTVLGRPTAIPVPAAALRLGFGEMARETLLASQRAVPKRLLDAGYDFQYPELREALRAALHPAS